MATRDRHDVDHPAISRGERLVVVRDGQELAGTFTITSSGTGTGSSPTLVFTYPGGAYAVAPTVVVTFIGGTGAGTIHQVATTPGTSSCTMQFFFTPAGGGTTYKYAVFVIG